MICGNIVTVIQSVQYYNVPGLSLDYNNQGYVL